MKLKKIEDITLVDSEYYLCKTKIKNYSESGYVIAIGVNRIKCDLSVKRIVVLELESNGDRLDNSSIEGILKLDDYE